MKKISFSFLLLCAFLLTSCANKSLSRYDALMQSYDAGGVNGAIDTIETEEVKENLYGSNTEFLYYYDLGLLYHYKRDYKTSIQHLQQALQINEDLYAKSLTAEVGAILLNDNVRDYRPRAFELLVLYEIQVLNYLALGDVENAAVEVRAAQVAMEELYQKDNKKANDNGFLRYLGAVVYELAQEKDDASIAYYKAVKAYEESKTELPKEVWGFVCNRLKREGKESDLGEFSVPPIELEKAGDDKDAEIVVIAYGGHSPILGETKYIGDFTNGSGVTLTVVNDGMSENASAEQFHLDVPAIPSIPNVADIPVGQNFHLAFAIPVKREKEYSVKGFNVTVGGNTEVMESVLDSDDELAQNIEDDKTATMIRAVIRGALKAFAAEKAKELAQSKGGMLGGMAAGMAANAAVNTSEQADLRLGLFLPAKIYMTRLPVKSGTHSVVVDAVNEQGVKQKTVKCNVPVKSGQSRFVVIPAVF